MAVRGKIEPVYRKVSERGVYRVNKGRQLSLQDGAFIDVQPAHVAVRVEIVVRHMLDAGPEPLPAGLVAGEKQVTEIIFHHRKGQHVFRLQAVDILPFALPPEEFDVAGLLHEVFFQHGAVRRSPGQGGIYRVGKGDFLFRQPAFRGQKRKERVTYVAVGRLSRHGWRHVFHALETEDEQCHVRHVCAEGGGLHVVVQKMPYSGFHVTLLQETQGIFRRRPVMAVPVYGDTDRAGLLRIEIRFGR